MLSRLVLYPLACFPIALFLYLQWQHTASQNAPTASQRSDCSTWKRCICPSRSRISASTVARTARSRARLCSKRPAIEQLCATRLNRFKRPVGHSLTNLLAASARVRTLPRPFGPVRTQRGTDGNWNLMDGTAPRAGLAFGLLRGIQGRNGAKCTADVKNAAALWVVETPRCKEAHGRRRSTCFNGSS
jgi:hypothetical protein